MNRKKKKQTSKAIGGVILLALFSLYGCNEKGDVTADRVGQTMVSDHTEAIQTEAGSDGLEIQNGSNTLETTNESDVSDAEEGPLVAYKKNQDGTWSAKGNTYKYRKVLTGRMPQAAKDTTFIVLSNTEAVSFQNAVDDMLSDNSNDHFDERETILVEMK